MTSQHDSTFRGGGKTPGLAASERAGTPHDRRRPTNRVWQACRRGQMESNRRSRSGFPLFGSRVPEVPSRRGGILSLRDRINACVRQRTGRPIRVRRAGRRHTSESVPHRPWRWAGCSLRRRWGVSPSCRRIANVARRGSLYFSDLPGRGFEHCPAFLAGPLRRNSQAKPAGPVKTAPGEGTGPAEPRIPDGLLQVACPHAAEGKLFLRALTFGRRSAPSLFDIREPNACSLQARW